MYKVKHFSNLFIISSLPKWPFKDSSHERRVTSVGINFIFVVVTDMTTKTIHPTAQYEAAEK